MAMQQLHKMLDDEVVVSSLACTTIDWYQVEDRPLNFYLFGGMGMASSIALGMSVSMPSRRIIGMEGDGSVLMNLGSLASISVMKPENLILIIWDNEVYESTGGQVTHTGRGVDLSAISAAAGIKQSHLVETPQEFERLASRALKEPGPWVIVAKVVGDVDKSKAPPWRPVYYTHRFLDAVSK